MRIANILIAIPLFSVAAGTGRVERCNFDLRAPSRQIALHATEGLDTAVEASIRSDGTIPNLSGWRLLLWYGDAATNPPLGVAFTNISLSRGVARWDIPGAQIATNGRFTVQIVGSHTSGRSEEWARGWLSIDRNSASSFEALTFGTPGWALATNVQAIAAAEAAARAAGDLVAMTNWQARVDALTNGAALGATALQPAATNGWTVGSHAGLATWGGATSLLRVTYVPSIMVDTSRVVVAYIGAVPELEPVPLIGDTWAWDAGRSGYYGPGWLLATDGFDWMVYDPIGGMSDFHASPTNVSFRNGMQFEIAFEFGSQTNQVPVTNTVHLSSTDDLDAHNTNGLAHADIRDAIDAIPLPPTNAVAGWLVWDAGSNCYWQVTATNLRFYVWGVEP